MINKSVPLKGFRLYNALSGLNQASGLAGGLDLVIDFGLNSHKYLPLFCVETAVVFFKIK